MSGILAIDPGSERSAFLLYDAGRPTMHGILANEELVERLLVTGRVWFGYPDAVAIEQIEPRYGLQAGWEVLDTARWVGRFEEACRPLRVNRLKRSEILRHLGVVTHGKDRVSADAGVRQALIDRFGGSVAIGRKGSEGPLHGISKDVWAALAVAVTHVDQEGVAA